MEQYRIDAVAMIRKHGGRLNALSYEQIAELYTEWFNKTACANWLSPRERTIAMFYEWATTAPCDRRRDRRLPALPGEHVQVAGPNLKPKSCYLTEERYPLGDVSPYDIPVSMRSHYNKDGDQVVIDFKYISDSNEPAAPQQHDSLITWMLGINSGRLYGIKINANGCVLEAIRLKDAINKALEHLIEHPHHKDRQDNYRLAKESLIEKSDSIFGIETNDKLQR